MLGKVKMQLQVMLEALVEVVRDLAM